MDGYIPQTLKVNYTKDCFENKAQKKGVSFCLFSV